MGCGALHVISHDFATKPRTSKLDVFFMTCSIYSPVVVSDYRSDIASNMVGTSNSNC